MFEEVPLRRVVGMVNGGTPTSKAENWGGDIAWATPVDVGQNHGGELHGTARTITEDGLRSGSAIVPAGSVLVSSRAPIGYVAQAAVPMAFNQGCKGLIPRELVVARFLAYALQHIRPAMAAAGTGTTFQEISGGALAALTIPLPNTDEQRAIADFLDRETTQIDAMVDAQERLVALLEERTRALLTHAVTGRISGGPATKPSGLRWAGDVPEHWEVGNIRRYAAMKTGHTPSRQHPEYWEDCTIPWFTLADVWQLREGRTHISETSQQISELGLANSAAELLPAGTVMLSRTASVGFSGIMTEPMATSQDYWNWVCGPKLMPEYLLYMFRASFDDLRSLTAGSTHKTIYEADAAALRVVIPAVEEQRQIVQYLAEHLARMDAIIAAARESIALMTERRAAVISAAVTGRIDVRTGIEQVERDLEEARV